MQARKISLTDIEKYWNYDLGTNELIPTEYAIMNNKKTKLLLVGNYKKIPINGIYYMYHRILYQLYYRFERLNECDLIDHIDGNSLNNDINNLRRSNKSENGCNRVLAQKNNKLGYKNISLVPGGYRVCIAKKGKKRYSKCFYSLELAILHRDEKLKEYHGDFMNLGYCEWADIKDE